MAWIVGIPQFAVVPIFILSEKCAAMEWLLRQLVLAQLAVPTDVFRLTGFDKFEGIKADARWHRRRLLVISLSLQLRLALSVLTVAAAAC